ncbi:MAG: exosortase F system-associated protein [Ignavibacteriae bacterium]|nr:exosortase F system-associated protein [Ignavibacteriota bacterium]
MVKQLLKDKKRILLLIILIFALVLIRFFEGKLFYDPFLEFFKTDFQNKDLPEFNTFKLFLNLFLRFTLNSAISVGIISVLFKDKSILKFSIWLFVTFFFVLILFFAVELYFIKDYLLLFYTRRFLIQPILLILFIPAFYYQKLNR